MSTGSLNARRRRAARPLAVSLWGLTTLAPWLLLALAAAAVHVIPGAGAALEYRAGDALREPWRLLSAHLTHFGVEHLAIDAAALLLLGGLTRGIAARRVLAALLGAALAIPLALEFVDPAFANYRGLSGLDTTLFALVLVTRLRASVARRRPWSVAALTGLGMLALTKIVLELVTQQAVFVDASVAGFVPAPLAHACGALVGVLAATLPRPGLWRPRRALRRLHRAQRRSRVPGGPGRALSPKAWARWGSVS